MAKEVKLYDYDTEEESLKRRQAILDSMRQSASQPLGLVQAGGMSAAPGLGSVLGKLGQQFLAQYGDKKLKEERAGLAERSREDLRKGFEGFYRTAEGYEAPSMAMAPGPDGKPAMQKVPGDKRRAIFEALASGHPVLRQFAMQQLEQEGKGGLTAKDLLGIAAPTSVFENPNDPSKWRGKRDIGEVGGTIYDKDKLETVQLGGAKPSQAVFNGDLYEVSPSTGQWKKLDNAPKISTSVSVGGPVIHGQKAGMAEYFKSAAGQVQALGERARMATDVKQTLSELQNLDSRGIFSNVTTGPATFLANLGEVAGVPVDTAKLGNTEAYNALTTDLWQGLVSKFGGNRGVTKEEAVEIKKMLPLAANSPQARQQLFRLLNNVADRQIVQFQNANRSFAQSALQEDPTIFSEGFADTYVPEPSQPMPVTQPAQAGGGRPVIKWGDLK